MSYVAFMTKMKRSYYKLKLLYKVRSSSKGYRSYADAVSADNNWEKAYEAEVNKLEELGKFTVIERSIL